MAIELIGKNFIAGEPSSLGSDRLTGHDPKLDQAIPPDFSVATSEEIATSCKQAQDAFRNFKAVGSESRASLLERIAIRIGEFADAAIERAELETALPKARLTGEVARTQNQLRMFASLVREGSWVDARIDHGDPTRKPLAKPDLRRMLIPLGPVAVFGASNFPFAFSVAGGDTASAFAAGCTVVFKAHPAHPGTCDLIAQAIDLAVRDCDLPSGTFSMLQGGPEIGAELVRHEAIEAVGFTGSFSAGTALSKIAMARPRPIPVYAEMGSTNPVVVLPGAICERLDAIAEGYCASLTLGVGQFCTNPGLLIGIGDDFERLCEAVVNCLGKGSPGTMLTAGIRENFFQKLRTVEFALGIPTGSSEFNGVESRFFRLDAAQFLNHPYFLEEIFGPAAFGIRCNSVEELLTLLDRLPGQLTATVHSGKDEKELAKSVLEQVSGIAGRVLFNGFPTGVEVCSAMQHGGPFPATSDVRATSVGTAAIFRFVRPIAFQDLPDDLLPPELQESNPCSISRLIDGVVSR